MPVPKRKTSKSRRDRRQSCKFVRPKPVLDCGNCGEAVGSHQACPGCGFYKGRKIFATKGDREVGRRMKRELSSLKKSPAESEGAPSQAE